MADLAPRTDLDQLRRQAEDLLDAARSGDSTALSRIRAVSDQLGSDSARLAVAQDYGFPDWARLEIEVERRLVIDAGDAAGLEALLARHPELAVERMQRWCDHRGGASPLGYVAMLRYDTATGEWRDRPGTAALARAL